MKVNAVLDPGSGLADAVELLRFCLRYGYQLRIIEQMPLDAGHQWRRDATLRADDILTALGEHFTLSADPAPRGRRRHSWAGGRRTGHRRHHRLGVARVLRGVRPHPVDRGRSGPQLPVRHRGDRPAGAAAGGADDDALATAWRTAMWRKAAGHGINDPDFIQPQRPMSAIGG